MFNAIIAAAKADIRGQTFGATVADAVAFATGIDANHAFNTHDSNFAFRDGNPSATADGTDCFQVRFGLLRQSGAAPLKH